MKKNIQQLFLILLLLIINVNIFSQEFSYEENKEIDKKIDSIIMRKYSSYAGLTETGTYIDSSYIQKFKDLFKPGAYIYNDIEPGKNMDKNLTTINSYVDYILKWYDEGLVMKLTNIKKDKNIQSNGNNYIKIVTAKKEVFGNHERNGYYEKNLDLIFTVEFNKSGNHFDNFKISEIKSAKPSPPEVSDITIYYGESTPPLTAIGENIKWYKDVTLSTKVHDGNTYTTSKKETGKYKYFVTQSNNCCESEPIEVTLTINRERTGPQKYFIIDFYYTTTSTKIHSKSIDNNDKILTNWSEDKESGFNVGGEISYFFKNNNSIGTGLVLTSYNTVLKLGNYESSYNTKDIDNDNYLRIINASDIKENVELTYLDIPLFFKYKNSILQKIEYSIKSGVNVSFLLSAKHIANGTISYRGYYPDYNITLIDLPEYDFYTDNEFETSNDLNIKPVNFSAFLSFGVLIPLNNYINLNLGPYVNFGLSNISDYNSSDYQLSESIEDYSSLIGAGTKTVIQAMGFQIGLSYKLSK